MSDSTEMTNWEYLIVALPDLHTPTLRKGESLAVDALNKEGVLGWEAFATIALEAGGFGILLKRPLRRAEA